MIKYFDISRYLIICKSKCFCIYATCRKYTNSHLKQKLWVGIYEFMKIYKFSLERCSSGGNLCIYRRDRSRLFRLQRRGEVDLHNTALPEFEANKQQREANLNKVTQLEHKNITNGKFHSHEQKRWEKFWESVEMEILFFLQQRELSPSPPSCSEPERLAEKTWSLVGEFYLQLFITGLWSVSFHSFAWVGFGLVWSGWKKWSLLDL